jgi:hypothetical protein
MLQTSNIAMPSGLAYASTVIIKPSEYLARIGRRGGKASTPAKREAARRNACKRWGKTIDPRPIPLTRLHDGTWYRGRGRNSSVGLWDRKAGCFWTVAMNDFADPIQFPKGSRRQVRLKQENYRTMDAGTFVPLAPLKT